MSLKACSCGSGLARDAIHDARGIFVAYACDGCREERLGRYRPEIFEDPNYAADEPIEPEEY